MTQASTPVQGEFLAGRYRLDVVVDGNSNNGYSLWRGTDSLLSRDVSIELRVPGGESARSMLSAAGSAGRIQHANVVGVYDAVDEGDRAFVVREWIEGRTLTDVLRSDGPFDPYRAASLARAVADAIAAIHRTGTAHGRLDPGAVLLNDQGEITITHLELSAAVSSEQDVKAVGGLLYAALTGAWPLEASVGFQGLPEAIRVDGRLCSPRQVRAGIPSYLDALVMDLLDPGIGHITADALAQELRRYDIADPDLGPLSTLSTEPAPPRAPWKRFGIPIAGIACVLVAGLAIGTVGLPDISDSNYPLSEETSAEEGKQTLRPATATILDPQGDGTEVTGAELTIDGKPETAWQPDAYRRANFGGIKSGMGVVIDVGKAGNISEVTVSLSAPGASLQLGGATTRGSTISSYRTLGQPVRNAPIEVAFVLPRAASARFVVVWITELPRTAAGGNPYQVGVQEIKVYGS